MEWQTGSRWHIYTAERYQISKSHVGPETVYTAWAPKPENSKTLNCLGCKNTAAEAKQLCEEHHVKTKT